MMKFLISYTLAFLCLVNIVKPFSIESTRVEIEFRGYMIELEIVAISQVSNVTRVVQAQADSYYKAQGRLRDDISALLFALGSDGIAIGLKFNTEANALIISLINELSDFKLFTNVLAKVTEIKNKFVKLLEKEIKLLEDEIDKKPSAVSCWDENKKGMRKVVTRALSDSRGIIDTNLVQLDQKIKSLSQKIENTVRTIKTEVLATCASNSSCVVKYVS
jgi:hypothetical protein